MLQLIKYNLFIICFTLLLFHPSARAETSSNSKLLSILDEAEDYILVKPSRTIELLTNFSDISSLSNKNIIKWHITVIRASVSTNNLNKLKDAINKVIKFSEDPYFQERLNTILSGIGIWFRKSGDFEAAKQCFKCALAQTIEDKIRVKLLINLGLVYRHVGDKSQAHYIYTEAQTLAKKLKYKTMLATTENNLGVIALEQNNLSLAERHFRKALSTYQALSKRSGIIISSINLLTTFYLQNEEINYHRLFSSVSRQTNTFPDKTKKAYLYVVNTAFNAKFVNKEAPINSKKLHKAFVNLQSRKLQAFLKSKLPNILNEQFIVPKFKNESVDERTWLTNISQCQWNDLDLNFTSNL